MWNSWWISPAAGPYWMPCTCIAAILMAKICSNSLKINAPFRLPKIKLLGSLSNGDSNERWKSSRFRLAKPQLISLPLLHTTTTWKCLKFLVLSRTWTQDNNFLFLFLNFNIAFSNSTPEKFANIWRIEQVEISAIKCEVAWIHFLSDVFVAFVAT